MTSTIQFDAIVIGAGAGGLCAAARLGHAGHRTLVVERLDKVGGRASTDDIDGFKVNNGAIVIETGGITEQTFAEVGAEFDVRSPNPPVTYRIKGKNVDVASGGWGFLMSRMTRQGALIAKSIGAARNDSGLPEREQSLADWLRGFTKNATVHGMFRNLAGSVFAVSSEELPARVFLTYFTRKSAFKRFGYCPDGTIGLWRALAAAVERDGGSVWLDAEAVSIDTADGHVSGVTVQRGGETIVVTAPIVVSDTGPAATARLVGRSELPAEYVARVDATDRPCSMIAVNFASERPLVDVPGMLTFATTKRLCYVANFTDLCPEMAPDGWHLYVGAGVPEPAVGPFDEEAETALVLADLRAELPGFDAARILSVNVMRDGWPPQRAVAGYDLEPATPIAGLWNVGDGVKEYANGGTTACAETAKLVVDQILAALPRSAAEPVPA